MSFSPIFFRSNKGRVQTTWTEFWAILTLLPHVDIFTNICYYVLWPSEQPPSPLDCPRVHAPQVLESATPFLAELTIELIHIY